MVALWRFGERNKLIPTVICWRASPGLAPVQTQCHCGLQDATSGHVTSDSSCNGLLLHFFPDLPPCSVSAQYLCLLLCDDAVCIPWYLSALCGISTANLSPAHPWECTLSVLFIYLFILARFPLSKSVCLPLFWHLNPGCYHYRH